MFNNLYSNVVFLKQLRKPVQSKTEVTWATPRRLCYLSFHAPFVVAMENTKTDQMTLTYCFEPPFLRR
jgi:hypothetical protein